MKYGILINNECVNRSDSYDRILDVYVKKCKLIEKDIIDTGAVHACYDIQIVTLDGPSSWTMQRNIIKGKDLVGYGEGKKERKTWGSSLSDF